MNPTPYAPRPTPFFLSLDTATDRPTLALGSPQQPGADAVIAHRHDLSRDIDAVTRSLFEERGVAPATLHGIVVADGPGSFTGLRIGIAFAKGLARALGIPLYSAPSMLGAARAVTNGGAVLVEYDALRGDVYRGAWSLSSAGVVTISPPAVVRAGSPASTGNDAVRAGPEHASAAALLRLVGVAGGAAQVTDPAAWEPSYGRLAEAEARRLAAGS